MSVYKKNSRHKSGHQDLDWNLWNLSLDIRLSDFEPWYQDWNHSLNIETGIKTKQFEGIPVIKNLARVTDSLCSVQHVKHSVQLAVRLLLSSLQYAKCRLVCSVQSADQYAVHTVELECDQGEDKINSMQARQAKTWHIHVSLYTAHSSVSTVHCTSYIVCIVHCTVSSTPHCKLFSVRCTVRCKLCLYIVHFTMSWTLWLCDINSGCYMTATHLHLPERDPYKDWGDLQINKVCFYCNDIKYFVTKFNFVNIIIHCGQTRRLARRRWLSTMFKTDKKKLICYLFVIGVLH